ncbi:unnamed protein product [Urochloa decumbens]|uniref:HMA domain-containing protein n=1 Tax=Urochloa decumbens TaxID=240449 RepID=A0ABC9G0H4_9POAL
MASGEAEPLQYTTTVLRVSVHCEGCKKKVKKVLHNIEGVYKVTVDAAQHKVTVTGSLGAEALIKRLHKAGKQAALWPAPAPAPVVEAAKKPEEVAPAPPAAAEGDKAKEAAEKKAEAKPKEAAKDKKQQPEAEGGKEKKPEKDKVGSDTKPEKAEAAAKPKKDAAEVTAPTKEKGSTPDPAAKESAATGEEEPSGGGKKQGKKKKNKQHKEGGESEAAPAEKTPEPSKPAPVPAAAQEPRPLVGFPYYAAAQPVMSYNVAHPSSSVSYYAPTPVGPMMQPMATPPPPPYAYPPYPAMMPEFMYGPPGVRSSPPQESYNNMFNEENANSCTVM